MRLTDIGTFVLWFCQYQFKQGVSGRAGYRLFIGGFGGFKPFNQVLGYRVLDGGSNDLKTQKQVIFVYNKFCS